MEVSSVADTSVAKGKKAGIQRFLVETVGRVQVRPNQGLRHLLAIEHSSGSQGGATPTER